MISRIALIAAFFALPIAPATGQSMAGMPGMTMPMPAKKAPAKKPARVARPHTTDVIRDLATSPKTAANPAVPQSMPGMGMTTPPATASDPGMPGMNMPATASPAGAMDPNMPGMAHGGHDAMTGALGRYPMEREASGTAWQPDATTHQGLMKQAGDWSLMAHATLNLVGDTQGGPRGADKAFVSGMLMGMAQRPIGKGTLQFKAMLSPDPLMGKAGYPLLLASGETADGDTRLVDRQHPHDLVMELSASVSQPIGKNGSVFLYGALPGEPAFGPPAFMHREAILDSPEAPITHHWLDSTHISFGVLTGGLVLGNAKLEVSRFNGREPDQYRYNIETGALDSTAVRVSWNPIRTLALQGSYGYFKDPEQLEPGVNQKRLSASILYADEIAPGFKLATTLAWGRKTIEGRSDDAYAAEASVKHKGWTVFGRGEVTQNSELIATLEHGPAYTVGKASLGLVRDVRLAEHLSVGIGGLVSVNFVPGPLAPLYGGHNPKGAMGFLRFRLD